MEQEDMLLLIVDEEGGEDVDVEIQEEEEAEVMLCVPVGTMLHPSALAPVAIPSIPVADLAQIILITEEEPAEEEDFLENPLMGHFAVTLAMTMSDTTVAGDPKRREKKMAKLWFALLDFAQKSLNKFAGCTKILKANCKAHSLRSKCTNGSLLVTSQKIYLSRKNMKQTLCR